MKQSALDKLIAWGKTQGLTEPTAILEAFMLKVGSVAAQHPDKHAKFGDSPFFPPDPTAPDPCDGCRGWDCVICTFTGSY